MDKRKITIIIAGTALIYFLMSNTKAFASPTKNKARRGCDPFGCGTFGASRSGGSRKHKGIDFVASPGESIFSPISGKITRYAIPYADDSRYKGIEIQNDSYTAKMFYLTPAVAIGAIVTAGQKIGIAQNISAKYGASMTNHVHFEVYDKNGTLLNPTNSF